MIPTNEKGVEYVFYRNHEKLGFEKIKRLQGGFPDIIAYKNGVEVGIELEFKLSTFYYHYLVDYSEMCMPIYHYNYIYKNKIWYKHYLKDNYEESVYSDPEEQFTTDKQGRLIYKTLKDKCQYVIYWKKDCDLPNNIEGINLNEF